MVDNPYSAEPSGETPTSEGDTFRQIPESPEEDSAFHWNAINQRYMNLVGAIYGGWGRPIVTDYTDRVNSDSLYRDLIDKPMENLTPAALWILAKNILEIRQLCQRWSILIKNGEWVNKKPDPLLPSWELYRARKLVEELEADFDLESNRWDTIGATDGPGFDLLEGPPLMAFCQEFDKIRKHDKQLEDEAKLDRKNISLELNAYVYTLSKAGYCGFFCPDKYPFYTSEDGVTPYAVSVKHHEKHTRKFNRPIPDGGWPAVTGYNGEYSS